MVGIEVEKQRPRIRSEAARMGTMQMRQAAFEHNVTRLSNQLRNQEISLADWQRAFKAEIKSLAVTQAAVGRGDWRAMTQSDWGRVGAELRHGQYAFLSKFAEDIAREAAEGKAPGAKVEWRAKLYRGAGVKSFWRGAERALGIPTNMLPAYPAEDTLCDGNCQCRWNVEEVEGGWSATWELGPAEHCATCLERAGLYRDIFIAGETEEE